MKIGNEQVLTRGQAAEYLGIKMDAMKLLIAKSAAGLVKPRLNWIRLHDKAPYQFRIRDLDEFIKARTNK